MVRIIPLKRKAQHEIDIASLSKTALMKKYSSTYNSWRNRKSRAKPRGNWPAEFDDFSDFLRAMGPCPGLGYTLDRVDNDNPMYGADLCRWADKTLQAENRSTTHRVMRNNKMMPLPALAKELGMKPSTLRYQLKKSGQLVFGANPHNYRPWPKPQDKEARAYWDNEYERSGGRIRWDRFEFLIKFLMNGIAEHSEVIEREYEGDDRPQSRELQEAIHFIQMADKIVDKTRLDYERWKIFIDRSR